MFSVYETTQHWAEKSKLKVHAAKSVTSTNDIAKSQAASCGDDIYVYVCDHQSEGRGRNENSWHDVGSGTALLSSWSFALPFAPQPILSPALGLAVFRALKTTWTDTQFGIKPPNDLYCEDKKIAGLLIETIQQGSLVRLILGLGLNVWAAPELGSAGSLAEVLDKSRLTSQVFTSFLDRLLLEIVATFQESPVELSANQREILVYAINQYAPKKMVKDIFADGSIVMVGGSRVNWQTL